MAYRISYTHAAGTGHAKADSAADTLQKGKEFDQQGFHVRIIDGHDREYNLAAFEALHGGGDSDAPGTEAEGSPVGSWIRPHLIE